jgi:hypothetical protein
MEGWRHFSDYLDEMETKINALASFNYSVEYDTTANPDKVTFTQSGGSAGAPVFESLSMAYALGYASKNQASFGSHVGGISPLACVPIDGFFFQDRRPAREYDLAERRFGRNTNVAWGSGELATLVITLEWSKLYRIMDGPLRSGKIRIGGLSSDYTDCFVYSVSSPEVHGSAETAGTVELEVYIPEDQTHTIGSTASFTDPWALVERGYVPSYFMKIEGLPFLFCETKASTIGVTHPTHSEAQSLIIDDSSAFREKINREGGIVEGSPLTIGIKDSSSGVGDVHGIFGSPSGRAVLDGTVYEYDFGGGASATQAVNVENIVTATGTTSTDGFASSGFCYLGKECIQYTAKSSTSLTCNFQTRGTWGSTYRHGSHVGPSTHKILSDRPVVWHGRIVELWVCFVDPIAGLPSMTAWEETGNQLMVGLFEVRGTPGFDRGLWSLELRPLSDRLKRKPESALQGALKPYAGITKNPQDLWVAFNGVMEFHSQKYTAPTLYWILEHTRSASEYGAYMSLQQGIQTWLDGVERGLNYDQVSGSVFGSSDPADRKVELTLGKISVESGGVSFSFSVNKLNSYTNNLVCRGQVSGSVPFVPQSWDVLYTTAATNFPYEVTMQAPLTGQGSEALVVSLSKYEGIDSSDWPSADLNVGPAYASINGKEVISYTKVFTNSLIPTLGAKQIALGGVSRNVFGDSPVDAFAGGNISAGNAILDKPIHEIMNSFVESSGLKTASGSTVADDGPRGAFDEMDTIGSGYGLDDAYWDEAQHPIDPGFYSNHIVTPGGASLQKLVGGYLYANNLAIGPKRSGNRIKLGTISTLPFSPFYDATLRDSDLLLKKQAATVRKFSPKPNSVKLSRSFGGGKDTITVNEMDDIMARGLQSSNVSLPGLAETDFFAFGSAVGRGLVTQHESASVYSFKVRPTQDWRVGMSLDVSVTYPGIYDMANNALGLVGKGRILEVSRNLRTGEIVLVVMMGVGSAPLCYSATVTGVAGNVYTLDVFETEGGDPLFDRTEYVRVYNPGKSTEIDESRSITAVDPSAKTLTLSGSLGFTPVNGYTQVTFLHQQDSNITTRQQEFCHFNDGTRWI